MNAVSIIVPSRNEAENLGALLDEIHRVCFNSFDYEVIVINDGSTDNTNEIVAKASHEGVSVRLFGNRESAGQSAAIHTGVCAAKSPIVCMLDGDGQNPPGEIPKLVTPFFASDHNESLGLVAGQRTGRQDSLSKKLASRYANTLRSFVLKDETRDTGCGLKAFRKDAYLALPYFNHMHRYLPALFKRDGWLVRHVDVAHAPRRGGISNYSNFQRALVGIVDLMGVMWLIRRKNTANSIEVSLPGVMQK